MRPRIYFLARVALLVLLAIGALALAMFILSFAFFSIHESGEQFLLGFGQHGLLAAVISAEGIHQELPQEQLAQKVATELHAEFGIAEPPEWFKVIAEKRATFCCAPNLHRPSQKTALPGLLLAGDYTAGNYPATLEGAVLSGLRCASLIFES